ncbi:MAG: tetraacyldisaccharide 4'-kinase [Desulfobacterales bacterium]|nr:tetraacyldisaccharide 4'-kinase [Desulfobacterales bacterium]
MSQAPDTKKLDRLFTLGRPLAPIYGAIMRLRAWLYSKKIFRRHRLPVLVISVGNLSMGGTGKTPMVIYLARFLRKAGRRPAIISRGYGGKSRKPVNIVADQGGIHLPAELCGDEPRLLAESLAKVVVATGRNRVRVGRHLLRHYPLDTLVLDDGFQHLALERDLDLVLFSSRSLLDPAFLRPGRVLPGGPLREPPRALERADAFVITGITDHTRDAAQVFRTRLSERFPRQPVFFSSYQPERITSRTRDPAPSLDRVRQIPLFGFCGIADPEPFCRLLADAGFRITDFTAFPDHHSYGRSDLARLMTRAADQGARGLITTEKDLVKLKSLGPAPLPIYGLAISIRMEENFDQFLANRLTAP